MKSQTTLLQIIVIVIIGLWSFSIGMADKRIEALKAENTLLTKQITELENTNEKLRAMHKWIPVMEKLMTPLAKYEMNVLAEVNRQMEIKNGSKVLVSP